jgi:hypothetical protein
MAILKLSNSEQSIVLFSNLERNIKCIIVDLLWEEYLGAKIIPIMMVQNGVS